MTKKEFDPLDVYTRKQLYQKIRDAEAENARLHKERDEWERKSKRNGLAAAIGMERLQELQPKYERTREALEAVEFVISDGSRWGVCPWCDGRRNHMEGDLYNKPMGHAPDCKRQQALGAQP